MEQPVVPIEDQFWNDLKTGRFASMVKESSAGQSVSNAKEVYNVMKPLYAEDDDIEVMYGLYLNGKNKILSIDKMFIGSIGSAPVYPREIIKKTIQHKAASVILVHNHPSGDTNPSQDDQNVTRKVMVALSAIDVKLLDHIIIGDGYYSMEENGIIERLRSSQR